MIFIYGVYYCFKRRVAYKNEFCKTCNDFRIAELFRTFDIFHYVWIPLIPLGVFRRWRCTCCGKDPKDDGGTPLFGKYLLLVISMLLLIVCTLTLLMEGKILPREFRRMYFVVDIIAGLILVGAILWIVRGRIKQRINIPVPPLEGTQCKYCGERLTKDPEWHCRSCDVWRY